MPKVSILTAAYGPKAAYLPETAAGVQTQELPAGWELEWVVQEDGDAPSLAESLRGDDRVHYAANGTRLGISVTRNLALSRVTGDLIQVLDHDDVLLPGAIATLLSKFEQYPIIWAVAAADDLLSDGTREPWESALPFGIIPAGSANRWAEAHGGNWPVHCAGLMMRAELVRALGGWAGTPVDDDIVLFAALSELGDGWNEETVTWLYRQHPGQTTRSGTRQHLADTGRRAALQRIAALRDVRLQADQHACLRFGHNTTEVHVGRGIKQPRPIFGQHAQ
jgi:glycosyltransferase involved in cell wall biosynthesis